MTELDTRQGPLIIHLVNFEIKAFDEVFLISFSNNKFNQKLYLIIFYYERY